MGKRTAMQGPILVLLECPYEAARKARRHWYRDVVSILVLLDILLNPMAFSHYALFVRLEFQSLFWWNILLNKSQ